MIRFLASAGMTLCIDKVIQYGVKAITPENAKWGTKIILKVGGFGISTGIAYCATKSIQEDVKALKEGIHDASTILAAQKENLKEALQNIEEDEEDSEV